MTFDQRARDIEQLAIKLREAAFPNAAPWLTCFHDTRARWIRAATVAMERQDAANRTGYEAARADAIDRCLMERVASKGDHYRAHNTALNLAVIAIRAMDGRHAIDQLRREVEGSCGKE